MQNFEETVALNADVQREINKKCEKQIEKMRAQKKEQTTQKITQIKDAAPHKLFSDETFWQVINVKTLIEFEIPGSAAAFYLTGKGALKQMLEKGEIDAFEHGNLYIKYGCTSAQAENFSPKSEQILKPKSTAKNQKA